jgi:translation initiation factor IF-3
VPVPRRFDRSLPERDSTRINERIRVPEVRLIGPDGQQVGILKTAEALRYAQERDLDLVEVAADAKPPVCRVLDYSKYKYEQAQRQKAARKHQQQITIREIKFRPKIAQHDYDTKKGHVERFLKARDKVKVTIMFRGREVAHPERGELILNRLADELQELAVVEQRPTQDGRNMTMMLGPLRAKESDTQEHATTGGRKGERRRERRGDRDRARGDAAAPAADAPAEAPAEEAAPQPAAADAPADAPAAKPARSPADPAPEADAPAPGEGDGDAAPAKAPARSGARKATAKAK